MRNVKATFKNAKEPQIWSSVIRSLQLPLAEYGLKIEELLTVCGVDPDALSHPHSQLPLSRYLDILNMAAANSGNPLLGIDLGKRVGPEILGALGFLFLTSRTLYDGLKALCDYQNLLQESTSLVLQREGNKYAFRYEIYGMGHTNTRQDVEFSQALISRFIRLYSNNQIEPAYISFRHAASDTIAKYERLLSAPCYFTQNSNSVYINQKDIYHRGLRYDPDLTQILKDYLDNDLKEKRTVITFVDQVKRAILANNSADLLTAEKVARQLGLSQATLYRRLQHEKASFKKILDSVFYELACGYLKETNLTIYQISNLIGFSSAASFSRAFSVWNSGQSPKEFRNAVGQQSD
ncbi:AraC family transcriptional regulator [Alteromonas gilva]|uniref:AraC family transcriptional regulator n=1 Tax=Alteromonas gilva TaxID=2987522 RepID=A0ABT5L043_9ALTE|nr:AraC family transcriptional regulator [Alteromonas gilva]MDC8830252.1 AraC family transcriptional regulator [Alteromonas gilva]